MRTKKVAGMLLASALVLVTAAIPQQQLNAAPYRWYSHIFVIMLENHASDVLDSKDAPRLAALAHTYGLAIHYYAVTHPSEPNYVAMLGGSTFGIAGDANYTYIDKSRGVNYTITAPSLMSQLDAAGLTWKSYQQSMPYPAFTGFSYPYESHQQPLYVSRHNAFLNFWYVQHSPAQLKNLVPDTQLTADLRSDNVPNFGFIAPDLCHDMHGQWPYCNSPNLDGDARDQHLISLADNYVGTVVQSIMHASFWNKGNNAIVITFDEDDSQAVKNPPKPPVTGCCDALPGGGRIPAIVVTSHGPRGLVDPTPYNHYSLLRTIQVAFGLRCLQYTCDTTNVKIMRLLFTVKS